MIICELTASYLITHCIYFWSHKKAIFLCFYFSIKKIFLSSLAISHTSLDDDGAYTCRVKVQRSPLTFDRRFNVTVHVPPITNPPQANILVDTGSYASFEEVAYCNALNGKPHAQVEWLIPPQIDLADIRKETEILVDNYKTLKTKSVLRLVPRKHYNGLAARCQIRHPTLDQPVYYNVNISVECEYFY